MNTIKIAGRASFSLMEVLVALVLMAAIGTYSATRIHQNLVNMHFAASVKKVTEYAEIARRLAYVSHRETHLLFKKKDGVYYLSILGAGICTGAQRKYAVGVPLKGVRQVSFDEAVENTEGITFYRSGLMLSPIAIRLENAYTTTQIDVPQCVISQECVSQDDLYPKYYETQQFSSS